MLHRLPPPHEAPQVLTYPYRLTKERADEIQKSTSTVTHFARLAERVLFTGDEDRHEKLDERAAQDKVKWLREMIRYRFPSQTAGLELSTWRNCVNAINSYHRRMKQPAPIKPPISNDRSAGKRIFYPPKETENHAETQGRSTREQEMVNYNEPDVDMYDIDE
ncbi:hypothetical protein OESDEN_20889 [Oesophagostomum dentatum]|uniref:Uncharacterized protein n=1 Tax=Oesophagostomum dentatum TaxID=61180 RepID=A0A0B1S280_OESDE|nr:hypothetical protein OESDEN_20889 [Oesophagostomum dentatum]